MIKLNNCICIVRYLFYRQCLKNVLNLCKIFGVIMGKNCFFVYVLSKNYVFEDKD